MTLDLARLRAEHVQTAPPVHARKTERPQCQGCLQAWPCDTKQLLDHVDLLAGLVPGGDLAKDG